MVGGEFGVEGEAEETVFLSGGGVDGTGFGDGAGVGFPDAEFSGDFDEEDAAVRGAFEFHGLGHALGEDLDLPARVWRRFGGEGGRWNREGWKCEGGQQGRKAHRADTALGVRVVMRKGGRMSGVERTMFYRERAGPKDSPSMNSRGKRTCLVSSWPRAM